MTRQELTESGAAGTGEAIQLLLPGQDRRDDAAPQPVLQPASRRVQLRACHTPAYALLLSLSLDVVCPLKIGVVRTMGSGAATRSTRISSSTHAGATTALFERPCCCDTAVSAPYRTPFVAVRHRTTDRCELIHAEQHLTLALLPDHSVLSQQFMGPSALRLNLW